MPPTYTAKVHLGTEGVCGCALLPGPIPFSQGTAAVPESEVLDRVALWAL